MAGEIRIKKASPSPVFSKMDETNANIVFLLYRFYTANFNIKIFEKKTQYCNHTTIFGLEVSVETCSLNERVES